MTFSVMSEKKVGLFLLRDMTVKQTMNQELFRPLFKREREREKKALESSRGSVGFFVIFPLNKSAGRESGETTFHTAGLAPGPRPRKEMYY